MAMLTDEARKLLRRKARKAAHKAAFNDLPLADKLQRIATKHLAANGYFPKPLDGRSLGEGCEASEEFDYNPVEAEAIGSNGNLKPTWQGRA